MRTKVRFVCSWLLFVASAALTSPCRAWLEQSVRSDAIVVDVERDGAAVVSHDILLHVRGGPLKQVELHEVDADAEPLPDATITRARSGRAAGLPIPLTLDRNEDRLVGRIQYKPGVRSGTYLIRVRYRTDLKKGDRIRPSGTKAELRWRSPRFDNGIDSMRVLLRLPSAPAPPVLPSADRADDDVSISDDFDGVFLATLRRTGDRDELEIVRPHVAKGERVMWRAKVDPSAFDMKLAPPEIDTPLKSSAPSVRPPRHGARHGFVWALGGLVALAYALVVWLKTRVVEQACSLVGATPRAFVRLPAAWRIVLSGAALGLSAVAIVDGRLPTLAGLLMVASMAFASHRRPLLRPALRGPGEWVRLKPSITFRQERPRPHRPGRFLDAGSLPGFALFVAVLVAFSAGAVYVLPRSAYFGVAALLFAACSFPVFCTGRAGELPMHPLEGARRWLRPVFRRLARNRDCTVVPIARVPFGRSEADELRLLVLPQSALRGLVAIEVGVESHGRAEDSLPLPFVIVRVVDGSPSAAALPSGLFWTRGREADERVTVLHPRLPTRAMTLRLVQRLVTAATAKADRRAARERLGPKAPVPWGVRGAA